MKINEHTGLVLEGGGMRGVFTAGALDYFMDSGIRFPYAIGVSAGACNGLSYASRQRGRAKICNIDLLDKYHYIGFRYFFTKRSIMDFDLIFDEFPTRIIPYDYDTYFASTDRFVMVTSNCRTGEANYFEEKTDPVRLLNICRASCSLPYVCPISYIDEVPMLDGGICDAIPIRKAIEEGFEHNVVVLTRNKGYRKDETEKSVPWFMYRKYPALRESLRVKNRRYNETLEYVEKLERQGKVVVIRPEEPLLVDRIEQDVNKLTDLYNQGYACAKRVFTI